MVRWKISGIRFDVLRSHDILKLSVVEDESATGLIQRPKDLYDARLGIPNESRVCQTCTGSRRGVCDAPLTCDGHFGHIELPSAIYHPYHVRRVVKVLSKICLGCSRAFKKKARSSHILLEIDRVAQGSQEFGMGKRVSRKRKFSETGADKKLLKNRKRNDVQKWFDSMNCEEGIRVKEENCDNVCAERNDLWQSVEETASPPLVHCVKEEPIDYSINPPYPEPPGQKKIVGERSNSKDDTSCGISGGVNGAYQSGAEDADEVRPEPRAECEDSPAGHPREERPESSTENTCRYCSKGSKNMGPKFPKIILRVVTVVSRSGRVDTIQMVVEEKPRGAQIVGGFWDFVGGHPGSEMEKSRLLLPFEALKILRKVPVGDHAILSMDKVVTHPEAFILFTIPVTPNCNRLIMDDWSSTLMPRIILSRGGPNSKLEAIVSKVKQINSSKGSIKRTFMTEKRDVEELQLLVARHLRACKVTEFSSFGKAKTAEQETGGSLELKWLKNHVLSKRSNYSARTVVNGDPNISISEIGVPYEMALRLTLQERVNSVNLRKWQTVISDIKSGRMVSPPGPLLLTTGKRQFDLREKSSALSNYVVKVGDFITRCLQNGDYLFANRPPSLHKHSLIALRVKLHHPLTFAINPLICAPFDGDFDGDAFHIFVPQSVESTAELRTLMSVSAQMVCPQGGQALISLTQDTLLGAHLLTRSHCFLNKAEFSQLSMFCSAGLPPPAILKSPTGPLWTGKQLYSMTLPGGLDYGTSGADVFVKSGELLICEGNAGWLHTSGKGIVKAICDYAGSDAAVDYLDSVQAVLHQWLMSRGFSVSLKDYYVAGNRLSRSIMLQGVRKCLQKSEEASLIQVLRLDKAVQARILSPRPNSQMIDDIKHGGSFGLLLGENRRSSKITDLQRSAIKKFQSVVPIVDNLIYGYMDSENSLLAMVRSGSKGSMSRLLQQTACLGLQLYKGENLISVKKPHNKLFYYNQSLKFRKEDIFDNRGEIICLPGYWESKGIITSSFFDGLNPAEFFLHTMSARGGMLREGIEEPNKIMRNLFLFMRDLHVAYDGSVRDQTGKRIIQFQYGGLKDATHLAGEPVGALAATAIAEPSYSVKLDSFHSSQLLKAGPIQLLQETLFPRRESSLKMRDRCVILRLFPGFGAQRRALGLKRVLEKVPLSKFVSSVALEFSSDGLSYETVCYDGRRKSSNGSVKRACPWQCRIFLNKRALRDYRIDAGCVKVRLYQKFNSGRSSEGLPSIIFVDKFSCSSRGYSEKMVNECLVFFFQESAEIPPSTVPASGPSKVGKGTVLSDMSKDGKEGKQKILYEKMKNVLIPEVLNTIVTGHDDIEEVKIVWEDADCAARIPKTSHYPPFLENGNADMGELVLQVHTRKTKGAGKRGAAFLSVINALSSYLDDVDWSRSGPYSVQEMDQLFGVECARASTLQRLRLATKEMGKPVLEQHLALVADTMTVGGEVVGLSLAGYRNFCKDASMSTPFTEASFQEPKKNFFDMAVRGASDNLDGALVCAVWGRRIPLGSGAKFDALPMPVPSNQVARFIRQPNEGLAKSSSVKSANGGKPCDAKGAEDSRKKELHITPSRKSLFPTEEVTQSDEERRDLNLGSTLPPVKEGEGYQEGNGSSSNGGKVSSKLLAGLTGYVPSSTPNGGSCEQTPIKQQGVVKRSSGSNDFHVNSELPGRLHKLLHERYKAGERVDTESQKMILQEVLIHHPRCEEKIGCGVNFIKVDYHPEYPTTKCFHIVRTDGSTCDFSYRKCFAPQDPAL